RILEAKCTRTRPIRSEMVKKLKISLWKVRSFPPRSKLGIETLGGARYGSPSAEIRRLRTLEIGIPWRPGSVAACVHYCLSESRGVGKAKFVTPRDLNQAK